ncbi:hypothetical protein MKS83_10890 [Chryseobacterium sp. Y16C]|uniref:hypothetical protein n=1 Tax=Chryseobacterium sp. Y16C TaxID=2920939 RepID=UPI001F0AE388|nr:hypothetical protein [Chryseobacterium sp. Y16C]UMQ39921.1 hypothetical protein MKS83_10890 [Chryseobacterium sp. Y16C]
MKARISILPLFICLFSNYYLAQTLLAEKKYIIFRQKLILEDSLNTSSDEVLNELRAVTKNWHDSVKVYKEGKLYVEDFYLKDGDNINLDIFSQHLSSRINGFYTPYPPEKIKPIIQLFTEKNISNYIPAMQIQNSIHNPFLLAISNGYADPKMMREIYINRLMKELPSNCIPILRHNKEYNKWTLAAIQYNTKEKNFIPTTMFDKVLKDHNKVIIHVKKEYWDTIATIIRKNPYPTFSVVHQNFNLLADLYKEVLNVKKGIISLETSSEETAEEFYEVISHQYTQYKFLIEYQNIHKL